MKVGDPKKAAVLGVVALVAVGAAVFQLIPKRQPPVPNQQAQAQQPQEARSEPGEQSLLTRPFSHPLLAQREGGPNQGSGQPQAPPSSAPTSSSVNPPLLPPLTFVAQGEPEEGRQSEPEPEPVVTVRLQAVLSAEDRVALLEVDGEVRRVAVGQAIFEGVKVKTIRDDSITLQTPAGEQRLAVGATWEWKKK